MRLSDGELNRIGRRLNQSLHSCLQVLDSLQKATLVKKPVVDRDVKAAIRLRIEQAIETVLFHSGAECSAPFAITQVFSTGNCKYLRGNEPKQRRLQNPEGKSAKDLSPFRQARKNRFKDERCDRSWNRKCDSARHHQDNQMPPPSISDRRPRWKKGQCDACASQSATIVGESIQSP